MKQVLLGDIARATSERAGGDNSLPVYSVTKHDGFVRSDEYFKKQVFSRDLSNYKLVRATHFAYATIHLDEGSIGIAPEDSLVSPMYTSFSTDPNAVLPDYLIRFLKSPRALATYPSLGKGSAERRRSISFTRLAELSVPLPPLDEQRRIAAILNKADELRTKRREALAHLCTLTHSIFHSMFEQMEFPTAPMGSVATFFGGNSLPEGQAFANQSLGYLHLKVSDMNRSGNERLLLTAGSWSEAPGSKASTCPPGCVVLPKRGASISTNKKRLTVRHSVLDPNLMAVKPSPALDSAYLFAWFESFDLTTITSGSSVPQLNKQDLQPLPIPIPPLELQHLFATRIAAAERLKEIHRKHLAELDGLFASLQHRAFKGEL